MSWVIGISVYAAVGAWVARTLICDEIEHSMVPSPDHELVRDFLLIMLLWVPIAITMAIQWLSRRFHR